MADAVGAIESGALPEQFQNNGGVQDTTNDAFAVGFQDLLSIVLTQLTYQDPLKPMDNFEFVSQLAQFTQIQQTETMSDRLESMLLSETTRLAAGLLGQEVDIPAGEVVLTGVVKNVAFEEGSPRLTIETSDGRTISNIQLSAISDIREGT